MVSGKNWQGLDIVSPSFPQLPCTLDLRILNTGYPLQVSLFNIHAVIACMFKMINHLHNLRYV